MTYPHVQWLRESELKHGRCAMLAIVGIFAQQSFHIDGYPEAGTSIVPHYVCPEL